MTDDLNRQVIPDHADHLGEHDPSRVKGMGIAGMHERPALIGGTLQVESQRGRGTAVYLESPAASAGGGPVTTR